MRRNRLFRHVQCFGCKLCARAVQTFLHRHDCIYPRRMNFILLCWHCGVMLTAVHSLHNTQLVLRLLGACLVLHRRVLIDTSSWFNNALLHHIEKPSGD